MPKTPTTGDAENGRAPVTADAFSAAVNDAVRRVLLFHLRHHGSSSVEELGSVLRTTTTGAAERQATETLEQEVPLWPLYHAHLPKLERLGIVSWDRDTDVVSLSVDPERLDAWLSVALAEDVHGAVANAPAEQRTDADPIRVLYVEDYVHFADLVVDRLAVDHPDLTVVVASNAAEAIDRLDSESFDCIVSDYDMPAMTGIDLLQAIRDSDPDVPFILYTGMGSEETASEAIAHGASDYLRKGTGSDRYDVLAERIRRVVAETDN